MPIPLTPRHTGCGRMSSLLRRGLLGNDVLRVVVSLWGGAGGGIRFPLGQEVGKFCGKEDDRGQCCLNFHVAYKPRRLSRRQRLRSCRSRLGTGDSAFPTNPHVWLCSCRPDLVPPWFCWPRCCCSSTVSVTRPCEFPVGEGCSDGCGYTEDRPWEREETGMTWRCLGSMSGGW